MTITLGQYFPGNSVIHRLDPRVKIVLSLALIVLVFFCNSALTYGLFLAFLLGVSALSRIHLRFIIRGMKPILFIVLMTFVINMLFTSGGTKLWSWRFITITDRGVQTAVRMALRLILLVIVSQILTLTTSSISLTDGLESLLKPLAKIGFPAHELAMMMSIAMRFIPTLMKEADKIMKAQKARGADFETGGLIKRARAMLPLLVPLFISAFRRADELAMAMEARCYRGGVRRTRMKVLKLTRLDAAAVAVEAVFAALILILVYSA